MPWSRKSAYVVGAVLSVLLACGNGEVHDHDNLREDVLYCEEAVSALKACCVGLDSRSISCEYSYDYFPSTGCGANDSRTYSTKPDLGIAESQCILSRTCAQLTAIGVCARGSCR